MAQPPEIGSPAHARLIFRIYARHGEAPPSNYHLQTTDQAERIATEKQRWRRKKPRPARVYPLFNVLFPDDED